MIRPDILYGLTVANDQPGFELLAAPANDPDTAWSRWHFASADDMTFKLSRLDMSAIDYIGVDQRLKTASPVQVGHPIKGALLLAVLGQGFE
jgi:hypothetical protein